MFLMDGSTDAGNIEQKLIILLSCKKDDAAGEIKSYARFFSVATPNKADSCGLVKCLSESLSPLGIEDVLDQSRVLGAKGKPASLGRWWDRWGICQSVTPQRHAWHIAMLFCMASAWFFATR